MPTHIRAQVGFQVASMLPRDVMQVTPCFRHQDVLPTDSPNWQDLAEDLADVFDGWAVNSTNRQLTVRLYQIGLPQPNRPKAIAVRHPGVSFLSGNPLELALCLSFTGGQNLPQNRGRLFLPLPWLDEGRPSPRPSVAQRDKAAALVPLLSGLGGANVDWITWSPTVGAATKVERWWVDDEWDVQRKRGLDPTARTEGTTGG